MKTLLLYICSLWLSLFLYGQNKYYFSAEFYPSYYYNFLYSKSGFNYGLSLLFSVYNNDIHNVRLGVGINYATKSYYISYIENNPASLIVKEQHSFKYLNFPIIINVKLIAVYRLHLRLLTGFMFNNITDYKVKYYYIDGKTSNFYPKKLQTKLGINFLIGPNFSYKITEKWLLNISPFVNVMLLPVSYVGKPGDPDPNDPLSIGANLGIEYIFGKK